MRIGLFDSGIGGITVLKEALKMLPDEDYIYYADTYNAPYGVKPKDEVRRYIFDAADFIAGKGVKALVVACNTATSIAIKDLRERYDFPIIGMEPAVKPAVEKSGSLEKRVLVVATPLTLKEEKFQNLVAKVDQEGIVDALPLPELVVFAEKYEFSENVVVPYLEDKLSNYDLSHYGTVVLGCTHFPLFRDSFKKLLPEHIDLIDGNKGTVRHLKGILEEKGLLGGANYKSKVDYYISGNEINDEGTLRRFEILLERADFE